VVANCENDDAAGRVMVFCAVGSGVVVRHFYGRWRMWQCGEVAGKVMEDKGGNKTYLYTYIL
jgi:hypothetical protein